MLIYKMDMKNLCKLWMNSLSFLDNCIINSIIVIILVLYSSTIFDNINSFVGNIYNFSIIRLLVLLVIIYITPKSPTIGILLGISYIVSLSYMVNAENISEKYSNKNKEHFFPLVNENDTSNSFDVKLNNRAMNSRGNNEKDFVINNTNSQESCMQNYTPKYETVSDVCNPTATFKNELNAQGLNFPEGFDHSVNGSPL